MSAPSILAPDWSTANDNFRRLRLLRDADVAFGALGNADDNHRATMAELKRKAGSSSEALSSRSGQESYREFRSAEDRHWVEFAEPVQAAARRLVLAPAPDVDALAVKIQVIREFELDLDRNMPRGCMAIVRDDGERLAAQIGTPPTSCGRRRFTSDQAAAHIANAEQLAETIIALVNPDRHSTAGLRQAAMLLRLQRGELRCAVEAAAEGL